MLVAFLLVVALGLVLEGRTRRRSEGAERAVRRAAALLAREAAAHRGDGSSPDPVALAESPTLNEAAGRLAAEEPSVRAIIALSGDADPYVACIALAALERRADLPEEWTSAAIRRLRHARHAEQHFLIRLLAARASRPVIGAALTQLDEDVPWEWLAWLVDQRLAAGERVDDDTFRKNVPLRLEPLVRRFLAGWAPEARPELWQPFERWAAAITAEPGEPPPGEGPSAVDTSLLREFARIWTRPFDDPPAVLAGDARRVAEDVLAAVAGAPPRSVLVVGEPGAGKSTVIRAALERLGEDRVVFEAGAAAVNAGATFIGELEGRVAALAASVGGDRAVWVFPGFDEALYTGQHLRSPKGLLDALLDRVEAHELTIVGEVSPDGYQHLVQARPRVARLFRAVRLRPPDERACVAIAERALATRAPGVSAAPDVLADACDLAGQFVPGVSAPGNVVELVVAAAADVGRRGGRTLAVRDLLGTLSATSGVPLALLDRTAPLDRSAVTAFFEERILGQPDAVRALVDRIAMIKTGLVDPAGPLGVFLFVGPTGTGKTELAKALAELLFGSPKRLIRLDMSEFQTPQSLERLLADATEDGQGAELLSQVRRQPFSVLLLDEFEKAAPPIWDVFLQVFDDGRLTDQQGRTASFRRCVIILTSNVGTSLGHVRRPGFGRGREPFRPETVRRELARAFRPELLNRVRVVVFRPLARGQMRALLDKELASVLERPGIRGRPWAVELDESAVEFLIDRGFSPDLGARPLKRAVEDHLLVPLADAILADKVPEGDQFLFVTAPRRERIEVTFVDPDAEAEGAPQGTLERAGGDDAADGGLDLRALAFAPRADARATRFLLEELERVAGSIGAEPVRARKEGGLAALAAPGFWEDERRFEVLSEVEYLDRMDEALRTAVKLGERLRRLGERNGDGAGTKLASLLAIRLYVLDRAIAGLDETPPDAFLLVRPAAGSSGAEAAAFTRTLTGMYLLWAERRGMEARRLTDESPVDGEHALAVSGLGAGTILAAEHGLHVSEVPGERGGSSRSAGRVTAAVAVLPWPPGLDSRPDALLAAAREAASRTPSPTAIVRRYRGGPSPLVRDAVRGYRTGRLDRVLAGDFDVVP